jgi:hypothetical protein
MNRFNRFEDNKWVWLVVLVVALVAIWLMVNG